MVLRESSRIKYLKTHRNARRLICAGLGRTTSFTFVTKNARDITNKVD